MNIACVFCAIAAGEPSAGIVAQDAHTITLLDLGDHHHGNLLIAPRHHYSDIRNMNEAAIDAVILAVKRAVHCIDREFPGDGICVWQSTQNPSIPDIMHAHFHVYPRHAASMEANRRALASNDASTASSPAFVERLRQHMLDTQLVLHDQTTEVPGMERRHGRQWRGAATSSLWCGCSDRAST